MCVVADLKLVDFPLEFVNACSIFANTVPLSLNQGFDRHELVV